MHRGPRRLLATVFLSLFLSLTACTSSETCSVCQKEKCSDLLAICVADAGCACMSDCLGEKGIPGVEGCLAACGLSERPADFIPIEECVATACPDDDECSTPSGYTPPELDVVEDITTTIRGGGTQADCGFDPALTFQPDGAVLQLESVDKRVCVRLERRNDGPGSLANTSWTLLDMSVGPLGEVATVDNPTDLCWYSSHHNFRDWAHVWTGSTHHGLELEEDGHGGTRTYLLNTFEQGPLTGTCAPDKDGTGPLGAPVALFPFNP